MGRECYIGFSELYATVSGGTWTSAEEQTFKNFSQEQRNDWVSNMASRTDYVKTEDRHGTDGVVYTAFWIEGPQWYEELYDRWSDPIRFNALVTSQIPDRGGSYVFSDSPSPVLVPKQVLYVGSSSHLRERIASYGGNAGNHAGKERLQQYAADGRPLYVRWITYAAHKDLEASLQNFLQPQFIGQYEGRVMADDESLDQRYL